MSRGRWIACGVLAKVVQGGVLHVIERMTDHSERCGRLGQDHLHEIEGAIGDLDPARESLPAGRVGGDSNAFHGCAVDPERLKMRWQGHR